jgi:ankyrin repeat protein
LLNNSAEVKRRDDTGATALHYAALAGLSDACAVLLERGADVDDKDDLGRTALHLAVHAGQESVVARLVDEFEASVATRDAAGCSPLHYAASAGDLGCLKFLIMRGAVVSAEDAKGAQATHFAAGEGHAQVLKELISPDVGGADALAVDKRGRSALHYAAIKGAADCVKVLLSGMGVEINRRDDAGWTALHYAYREGHAEVFDVLMDAGADPSELYRIQRKASAPIERRIEASSDQSRPQQQPGDSKKKNDSKACVVM